MSDFPSLSGPSAVEWEGHIGMVRQADRRVIEFYQGTELNGVRSTQEGRPIYEPVDMIRIRHPGERDVHEILVREEHKHEFPRQWAAYKAGQTAGIDGTPLATLFPVEQAIVKQMGTLHIFTVEQLAGLTEAGITRLGMGGRQHVERAKKFMEASSGMANGHRLESELRSSQEQLEQAKAQILAMQQQMQILMAAHDDDNAPRRGRPRKAQPDDGDLT